MTIAAPLSKYKKNNIKIAIAVCIAGAIYCAYDGYYNDKFIERHTNESGSPDSTLVFNQKSPPFFIGGALLFGIYLFAIRNKKVVADENEIIISDKERISYDSIQKIDKTYFDSKGFFLITYKDENGNKLSRKLSDRTYDNLTSLLDVLVAKIS